MTITIAATTFATVAALSVQAGPDGADISERKTPIIWFAAWDGTDPIGSAGLLPIGRHAGRLRGWYVAPAWRGSGVGRALLDEVVSEARLRGIRTLDAWTHTAVATLVHCGWKTTGRRHPTPSVGADNVQVVFAVAP